MGFKWSRPNSRKEKENEKREKGKQWSRVEETTAPKWAGAKSPGAHPKHRKKQTEATGNLRDQSLAFINKIKL